MLGIGIFKCKCGRTYRGFSRGDITSKCHICQTENLPFDIRRGKRPDKGEVTDKSHYCNACKGKENCPIVEQVKELSSNDPIDFSNNKKRYRQNLRREL